MASYLVRLEGGRAVTHGEEQDGRGALGEFLDDAVHDLAWFGKVGAVVRDGYSLEIFRQLLLEVFGRLDLDQVW